MTDIIFVHGMFQNPKRWAKWTEFFGAKGYNCLAPAWPLHEGEPSALRANPPKSLGDLHLADVLVSIEAEVRRFDRPVVLAILLAD